MQTIRSEIWATAFLRRHNNLGNICVISRRGDPVAGQVWIELDHLDGSISLFTPAPNLMIVENVDDKAFLCRLDHAPRSEVEKRVKQEADFDPDFWLITLECRSGEHGLHVLSG